MTFRFYLSLFVKKQSFGTGRIECPKKRAIVKKSTNKIL